MDIFLNILFFVIGIVLLIKGADFFVSGASAIAKKLKVPMLIIGLTIVAFGTSLPELAVSISSAIKGSTDMAAGNVIGSNMFNMLFILGFVALFNSVKLADSAKSFDLPFMVIVTAMLAIVSCDTIFDGAAANTITRVESFILVGFMLYYFIVLVKNGIKYSKINLEHAFEKNKEIPKFENKPEKDTKELKVWQMIVYTICGLAAVVFGGECVSATSQFLAIKAGMSEALVGLTIVAMGTSLPEFATSVIAAKKGETDLALGNVIGSNILNIVLILGVCGSITKIPVSMTILTDLLILLVFTIVLAIMALRKGRLKRTEGIILICMFFAYMAFAIVRNYCFPY